MANEVILDDEAEALFRELGGTDAGKKGGSYDLSGLTETLYDHDKRVDPWRSLLVAYVRDVGAFFGAWRTGQVPEAEAALKEMGQTLVKLNKMPGHDGRILIRHQGRGLPGEGRASMLYDYAVLFGGIHMEIPDVRAAARRMGVTAADFPNLVINGFDTLAQCGITSLYLAIGDPDERYRDNLKASLTTAGAFVKMVSLERSLEAKGIHRKKESPFLSDENGEPDANLSMLAVVNRQKKDAVEALVAKVATVMEKTGSYPAVDECAGVFDCLFAFPKLKESLTRPPLELNNLSYAVVGIAGETMLADEAMVVRFCARAFGRASQEAARLLDSLYGPDFHFSTAYQVADRVGLATRLIAAIGSSGKSPDFVTSLTDHVLELMEIRMDLLSDEILRELAVQGEVLSTGKGDADSISVNAHPRLREILSFFRKRSAAKNKIKSFLRQEVSFTEQDYEVIARDFGVSPAAAQELISLITGCFDKQGHFLRSAFEKRIPAFCDHEERVFEFLWHFLKEHMHKQERIGFLNSLKLLIDRMSGQSLALFTLLSDFCRDPETVTFSDRNALMLCNVLLRAYNKELHQDIEMTPEEVLLVREGINREALEYARDLIDRDKEKFFLKYRHIHRNVRDALSGKPFVDAPLRYLLTLEREVYMLFALVGGITGRAILRSGIREYGDPDSGIYELPESRAQKDWLIQILQVLVRALGRVGETPDLTTLNEIPPRKSYFLNLGTETRHLDQVRRLLRWVDTCSEEIKARR
ncbi:MAG: hypothetical protein AB1921_13380 [Thermodesulfobacteriota bacterium]